MKDGIQHTASEKWNYFLGGRKCPIDYRTAFECKHAYVTAFLIKNPKYKPMFEGKSWRQIFKILGMDANA